MYNPNYIESYKQREVKETQYRIRTTSHELLDLHLQLSDLLHKEISKIENFDLNEFPEDVNPFYKSFKNFNI